MYEHLNKWYEKLQIIKSLSYRIKQKERRNVYHSFPYTNHKGLSQTTEKLCWNYEKYLDSVLLKS